MPRGLGSSEREARRRRRELDRQEIQFEHAPEHKRAIYEVERYENYLSVLRSVHQECGAAVDWEAMLRAREPEPPVRTSSHEDEARRALESYAAGWLDTLLGRAGRTLASLRADVESAERTDDWAFEQARERHEAELVRWQARRSLAERVLSGDAGAYREAVELADPFAEIHELGSRVEVGQAMDVHLHVHADAVVPSETKSLSADGRLKLRPMLPEQLEKNQLAYASSSVLRIAAELFALLPLESVAIAAVNEPRLPLVNVRIARETFARVDLQQVDAVRQVKSAEWNASE